MKKAIPLTITLPAELLAWVDELAKQSLASRSDILRQAALNYIHESGLDLDSVDAYIKQFKPKPPKTQKEPKREYDYAALAKKYPYVYGDHEMLEFLDDYYNNRL